VKDLKEFVTRAANRAENAAKAVEQRHRDGEKFKEEVINFFSYLMNSIESVTGGNFPSKQQIISEMKSRYLKKR
jgi:hypothetical protein